MAASDQAILDNAKDSLNRILQTDSSAWSEQARNQQALQIDKLSALIDRYETKVAAGNGRRIFQPLRRVNL